MNFCQDLPSFSFVFEKDQVELENGDEHPGAGSYVNTCKKKSNPYTYIELDHANEQPTTMAAPSATRVRSTRDAYVQVAAVAA